MSNVQIIDSGIDIDGAKKRLEEAEDRIERAGRDAFLAWVDMGAGFKPIMDDQLWRVGGYDSADDYCGQRWEMTKTHVYRLMDASAVTLQIGDSESPIGDSESPILPQRESQVRPLTKLGKDDERVEVWRRVVDNANGGRITAKMVEREVTVYKAEQAQNWITLDEWNALSEEDQAQKLSRKGDKKFNKQDGDNIEWARWSWNPLTGCLHDCDYCYARDIASRFYAQGFKPSLIPERLTAAANTKAPDISQMGTVDKIGHRNVFTGSMTDLFGKWVPAEWIEAVLDQIRSNPQWTFLLLTKFPVRMAEFDFPANTWIGTTVDRQWAVERAEKAFRKIRANGYQGVAWLSCEPMLERLTFDSIDLFDWVVMGGSSKSTKTVEYIPPLRDTMHLIAQADAHSIPVYNKTNLGIEDGARIREYPKGAIAT